ncbi:midasin [Chelonus insularis]|uniref:midasin n=1 Tax=Chelonus insularis TaxID=460826 RepID=UPI00158B126E|nr:midasin [Chelonus insularis]
MSNKNMEKLSKSLQAVCDKIPSFHKFKDIFIKYLPEEGSDEDSYKNAVENFCNHVLLNPKYTQHVAECFPQFLIYLLTITIPTRSDVFDTAQSNVSIHRLNCVILGQLISVHPDVLEFTLRYFDTHSAPFESPEKTVPIKMPKKYQVIFDIQPVTDYDIVLSTYNILQTAPNHFKHKWNWSLFYHFLNNENNELQWYALKCVAIILNMSEFAMVSVAKALIPNFENFLTIKQRSHIDTLITVDENSIDELQKIVEHCNCLVSVAGVLLPVVGERIQENPPLIQVPSMKSNLRNLALAVVSRKCVCLQGPVGCGKTSLIEYLANITGRGPSDFIKVQLGDQTDSKMLLGTYRCTDIPGEFIWQPGVVTEAVVSGKWLLLEDIDSAALDVASVLSNLMETGSLSVPGYRDTIYAQTGFQLFVTQRLVSSASGFYRQSTSVSNLLEKHWLCVNMDPLTKEELIIVVKELFPSLSTITARIIDVFLMFSMGSHENDYNEKLSIASGRLISTRDLIKWCSRVIVDYDVSSPESALKVFQNAIDIFCCSVPDQKKRLDFALSIAPILGIVKTKAEYFFNIYKPQVSISTDLFVAGRAKLQRKVTQFLEFDHSKVNFSFTRPSANLLERITCCVNQKEPVLLVGETGTGKTSVIQFLAKSAGHKLIVINMNQQSESVDLLGGYKPVNIKILIKPIREEFELLFRSYYAVEPNKKFLEHVATSYKYERWKTLVRLMLHSTNAALKRLEGQNKEITVGNKRKSSNSSNNYEENNETLLRWKSLSTKLEKLKGQVKTEFSLAFAFVEGSLIKALQKGYWILLDEINLASSETLECLSGLLEGSSGSLSLLERGDKESIKRHKDFTIFACMNPATDIGKKELPVGLRNRFTEFFVDELTESKDLHFLVNSYLENLNLPSTKIDAIVKFYLKVRKEAVNSLSDGTGHKPHFSLRTLCRALSIAASNPCGNITRSLYEAFCLSFLTQLDHQSYPIVQQMITRVILDSNNVKTVLNAPITKPTCSFDTDYINFEGYWVIKGTLQPEIPNNYILTSSVRRNLKDLVRVVSIGKMPVLLQGDTSVGKTSLITYLAKASGHVCVRINNHEHTDLQEYVGNYVVSETGKLVFKEGVLVEAMRKGYWIILDELNLAPSDVLEALNRVLDDNRELFIPETQQTIKAHTNFMLFATQNPPGIYGGRKVLSRAFRNRFVELHFNEIPANELQTILHERCTMPQSYCKQIINVMTELQIRRKSTATFMGKQGFITLRDLFRWGERYRIAPNVESLYDWSQHLADEGYLVLAAKVRRPEEAEEIREVIKKHLKRDVDPENLFSLHKNTSSVTRPILEKLLEKNIPGFENIVWTYHMRRMAVLVIKSCEFKEPVLLVGETGGGKTTVCQLVAAIRNKKLFVVNCHMHTESSDFLGNLRPIRDHSKNDKKLFEWIDGPLIEAMKNGDIFLADEISLADDSVLERMNSLLETERSLLLAEKNTDSFDSKESDCVITAHADFCFIGTMNPGGDYGKKELSPALRNRFTEIWCEGCVSNDDLQQIIQHNLLNSLKNQADIISNGIIHFLDCLKASEIGKKITVSIRDVLTWIDFINTCQNNRNNSKLSLETIFVEGVRLTYLDSLGSGITSTENRDKLKLFEESMLKSLEPYLRKLRSSDKIICDEDTTNCKEQFGIEPFSIDIGLKGKCKDVNFVFNAPTTRLNALKILRALQLKKPVLLEGSPGVGKTSLVSVIAKSSGHDLLRINLSDQTDVSDLFGADLPVEGGKGGQFAWKDGPFLRALKAGDWILLDELNLASQSVLEGLNACLDHRGEIYIPELGRSFNVKPDTKLFACQNPLNQGGARRGLPKSFLNRFTQVFIDALSNDDLKIITLQQFPELGEQIIDKIVKFNAVIASEAGVSWAYNGTPWEMNLRDITRWCELICRASEEPNAAAEAVKLIYADRMRTADDKMKVMQLFYNIFKQPIMRDKQPFIYINEENVYFDDIVLPRTTDSFISDQNLLVLRDQIPVLKSLAECVQMKWMPIVVGSSGTGKSSVVRVLAQLAGQKLRSIVVNSAMDTTEILGGFEQTDYNRHLEELIERTEKVLIEVLRAKLDKKSLKQVSEFHRQLEKIRHLSFDKSLSTTMAIETEIFLQRTKELSTLISAMETLDTCSGNVELASIKDKLTNLSHFVKQDNCLNAGGKFEWVDSVLVKCLQDGTWLLVDQVNLCSPAVLDRLNGLLEPGGVLTVGERGVDNDGRIHTIKPHQNFRLFLTMDPHYGEISRAMRNRGVEIYLLDHKKSYQENDLDIKSLMYNTGLTRNNHQEILLNIHQEVSSQQLLTDKLSTIQLLHCAFLITQQISRGFSVREAFFTSCIDVYIKSQYIQQPEIKNRLMSIIERIIDKFNVTQSIPPVIDLSAVTWNIRDLQENAQLTVISQQGIFLMSLKTRYLQDPSRNATTKFLNDYLNMKECGNFIDMEITKIFPYVLLNFFEKSSIKDISMRNVWLNKFICDSTSQNQFLLSFKNKIEQITYEILKSDKIFNASRPWYQTESFDITQPLCLRMYMKMIDFNYPEKLEQNKNKNIITVEEYSKKVHNYNLQEDNIIPLVTNFVPFATNIHQWITNYLYNLSQCDHKKYIEIRLNLQWFRRFYKQGQLMFIDKSQKGQTENNFTKMLLVVHYRWLRKLLLKYFEEPKSTEDHDDNKKIEETLKTLISEFDNFLHYQKSFKKLAKKVKRQLNIMRPFTSQTMIDGYKKITNYSKNFLLPLQKPIDRQFNLILLQLDESIEIKSDLIIIWEEIFNDRFNERMLNNIGTYINEFHDEYELDSQTNVKIVYKKILTNYPREYLIKISMDVQLWPLYEYGFILFVYKIHRQLSEHSYKKSNDNEMINGINTINNFLKFLNLPTHLVAILKVTLSKIDNKPERERLLPELLRHLFQYQGNYQFCNIHKFTSYLNSPFDEIINQTDFPNYSDQLSDTNENKLNYSDNNPVLIHTLSRLLLANDGNKDDSVVSIAPLGLYKIHLDQMKMVNDMLWRNSIPLNSKKYNYIENDEKSLISYINSYLKAIENVENNCNVRELIIHDSNDPIITNNTNNERSYNVCYKNPLDKLVMIKNRLQSDENTSKAADRGLAWIYLGLHQLFLFSHLGFIDPVIKTELKLSYTHEDINDLITIISSNTLDSYLMNDHGWIGRGNTSRLSEVNKCLENSYKNHTELMQSKGYRSSHVPFGDLVKQVSCFRGDVGSPEYIINSAENTHNAILKLLQNDKFNLKKSIEIARHASEILKSRQSTWRAIMNSLEDKFLVNYRELVTPIMTGLTQIIHGADILVDENNRLIVTEETRVNLSTAEHFLQHFVQFPTIGPNQQSILQLIDLYSSQNGREFIKTHLDKKDRFKALIELFNMLKNALYELYNYVTLKRELTMDLWNLLNELLSQIVLIWQKQRIEKEKAAAEAESLYKGNINVNGQMLTEEEEIDEQLRHLFPCKHDHDFEGIDDKQTLEQRKETNENLQLYAELITEHDLLEVYKLHSQIVKSFIPALWMKNSNTSIERNYIDPFIQRFSLFTSLYSQVEKSLSSQLSTKLYISFNVLASIAVSMNSGETLIDSSNNAIDDKKKSYDFYTSSNIAEVIQCILILDGIINRVKDYLEEWPEHPTLQSICIIIQRIKTFPVTSSVSRFLTGLELLASKIREWQENAHIGVSLHEYSASLTQQIIDWRKLELNCWKNCLDSTLERLMAKASKWWFFLYSLINSYVNKIPLKDDFIGNSRTMDLAEGEKDDKITLKKLIELLENFISQSTLAEFEVRLDLLLTFHSHVFYLKPSSERQELLAVFWNIYQYYKKFSTDIKTKINSVKAPIEKKLRDFVKIARWNDINYWSVKTTVEKTHRNLLKFIREYETELNQNISACLIIKPTNCSSEIHINSNDIYINPDYFIILDNNENDIKISNIDNSLIERSNLLTKKAKKLCKETILMSMYPGLRVEIDHLIGEFMNRSIELKNMEVDRTLPKQKQKSHAKSILQQKKLALADYFKTLTNIGLSYRKGLIAWQNKQNEIFDMTIPPLDVAHAFQKFDHLQDADNEILAYWDGCEKYYYQSCIYLQSLNSTFVKNQTDLGPQNIERCRGFSIHLLSIAQKQKKFLTKHIEDYVTLRKQIINLEKLKNNNDIDLPSNDDILNCANELNQLAICLLTGFEQIDIYFQTCPQENIFELKEEILILEVNEIPMVNAIKDDPDWKNGDYLINNAIKLINSMISTYDELFLNNSVVVIRSGLHFNFLKQCYKHVEKIVKIIVKLEMMFSNENEKGHPILMTMEFLKTRAEEWIKTFDATKTVKSLYSSTETNNDVEKVKIEVEELVMKILVMIQEKYKEATTQSDESPDDELKVNKNVNEEDESVEDGKENSQLEDNGFREKLIESLEKDIKNLQLEEVNKKLQSLLQSILSLNPVYSPIYYSMIIKIFPILQQFILFSQFYLNEQVAVFRTTCKILYLQLNVFLDLATKGFCMPKDLDLEEEDADGESTERDVNAGGMGLSDGEGKKDVSDRIESEDQLEDARPAGEEKEQEEDKNCEEEEGGIEMSENFDSKLQDIEKKNDSDDENKSDDEDDNDEDLDKEMGETEKGAEQLDEEIWKDDEESDNEEDNGNDTEEQGRGEAIGEKELSAKDDSKNHEDNKNDENNDRNDEKSQKKNEIDEMNEPDVNDDQIDPYHGNDNTQPECMPMDLPDDLNLDEDDDEGKEKPEENEENPFDVDQMKECISEEKDQNEEGEEKQMNEDENNKEGEESSDEENGESTENLEIKNLDAEESEDTENPNQQTPGHELDDKKDDEKENKEESNSEQTAPSIHDQSKETDAADQVESKPDGSRDKVPNEFNEEKNSQNQDISEKNEHNDGNDKGTGQAQSQEQNEGHLGSVMEQNMPIQRNGEKRPLEKRKNPGKSDEDRVLMDNLQPNIKKQKIMQFDKKSEQAENSEEGFEEDNKSNIDMCQHVKDSEKFDDCAIDTATEEQVKKQKIADENEEDKENNDVESNLDMHIDNDEIIQEEVQSLKSEVTPENDKNKKNFQSETKNMNEEEIGSHAENKVEVEGELVQTLTVSRKQESAFYTQKIGEIDSLVNLSHIERKRLEVEQMLRQWTYTPSTQEALTAWNCLSAVTETPARDLSEKLRLVLEPTQASRLKGDYRTGKRINMRKIIPYIASQFRKDKIWLRRTKPSKRDYQIILAVDDSSSMADNHSKELAFESLSLISKAMSYLEVGQLGVISFGESPKVLHPLGEPFNEQSGARLIQEMQFDQKKTMIGQLVDFTVDIFESQVNSRDNAKLLVVLSDGRGVFSEGSDYVNQAVRRAKLANIFLVFIIVESPLNKDSILDIRMPIFDSGRLLEIRSYMDDFPFPFYMILRDINAMPGVLSDALRQWFEVVGKIDT